MVVMVTCALCFQFDCTNTLNDQILENVVVHMENTEDFEIIRTVPALRLQYEKPGITYTLVRLPDDPTQGMEGGRGCWLLA